jgi:hypothetical protein
MTHYSEEQILIRAMPCPKCGVKPREHCKRKPHPETGKIKNHQERQMLWHQFVKSVQAGKKPNIGSEGAWHPIDYGDIF